MRKQSQATKSSHQASQLPISFPTKVVLDQTQRADLVALLSRLLLQVAGAQREEEANNDCS